MGNKSTGPLKGLDAGTPQKEEGSLGVGGPGGASEGSPGPSRELLSSLQSLGEESDYTLLPQSLHQVAEAYSLKEDYQWAIQFLQLEKLYHERLLSNLAAIQEKWEGQWQERTSETDSVSQEHFASLSQICKTHHRPSIKIQKSMPNKLQEDIHTRGGQCDENDRPITAKKVSQTGVTPSADIVSEGTEPSSQQPHSPLVDAEEEDDSGEEDVYEEGQEVDEEVEEEEEEEEEEEVVVEEMPEGTPEEEEVNVEWPAGVPQASAKDLVKLSHAEGTSTSDGLVSILKRRRASLDGLPPAGPVANKHSAKRKVRFSEPGDGVENDEMGGDSCLILLLLCLVTVVISIGGTALYCTLVDTYSNICTDFSQNVSFYIANVWRVFTELNHWLPPWT